MASNDRSDDLPDDQAPVPIDESLLRATERIWSTEPPSEITMRRIAAEAGVSVGVAYNYFDSKEALFGTMLDRVAERLSSRVASAADGREVLLALFDAMEASPSFHRLMAWLILEGQDASSIMDRYPVVADLGLRFADSGDGDPRVVAGMVALLGISLQTFGVLTNRAMGRDDGDLDLRSEVVDMFESWFVRRTEERNRSRP